MVGENAVDAKTLQSITTGLGHSLKIVKNGTEALKIGESRHFDLILLDIFLPDMKGYELIPEFKKKWPETGIITITEANSRELEAKVRKEGIIYYMIRPIDTQHLASIVNHFHKKKYDQKLEKTIPERRLRNGL